MEGFLRSNVPSKWPQFAYPASRAAESDAPTANIPGRIKKSIETQCFIIAMNASETDQSIAINRLVTTALES
jgi:hypothetical protein